MTLCEDSKGRNYTKQFVYELNDAAAMLPANIKIGAFLIRNAIDFLLQGAIFAHASHYRTAFFANAASFGCMSAAPADVKASQNDIPSTITSLIIYFGREIGEL